MMFLLGGRGMKPVSIYNINNEILVLGGESLEQEKAHSEVELLNVDLNLLFSGLLYR